ncbi:hypothetical protein [Acinetobacter sp. CFCC 10889]|uniref:hypothetical protein n=1 Tax=Acinetobacter sp. CFCC 10889 TaxID=1775557 RepID=UPI000DD03605|nr:hypothetical protein [Acinetobacter sp. CFCC 10889]
MKTIKIEIPFPDIQTLIKPTVYRTFLKDCKNLDEVKQVENLVKDILKLEVLNEIINAPDDKLRDFCFYLIEKYIPSKHEGLDFMITEALMIFFKGFKNRVGMSINDYMFSYEIIYSPEKYACDQYPSQLFDTKYELIKFLLEQHINSTECKDQIQYTTQSICERQKENHTKNEAIARCDFAQIPIYKSK